MFPSVACTDAASCSSGQYIAEECAGGLVHCTSCSTCPSSYYQESACVNGGGSDIPHDTVCAPYLCDPPEDWSGYLGSCDPQSSVDDCVIACDNINYHGTAVATCSSSGVFEFSGCEVNTCRNPTPTTGHISLTAGYGGACGEGGTIDSCDLSCLAGYTGSDTRGYCYSNGGFFTYSGCTREFSSRSSRLFLSHTILLDLFEDPI